MADRLAVELESEAGPLGLDVTSAVGLALRRNPRRAHLLVSTLLGKHLPTDPRLVYGAGRLLGLLVADVLSPSLRADLDVAAALLGRALSAVDEKESSFAAEELLDYLVCVDVPRPSPGGVRERTAVLGYAETATALGHAVADSLHAPYLHSTRRLVPGNPALEGFEEEHSHAPGHLLLPERPELFTAADVMVLVDDEFSTGRTVLNTIRALSRIGTCDHFVLAALVDVRSPGDRSMLTKAARQLGARLEVVSLATGRIRLPEGLPEAASNLIVTLSAAAPQAPSAAPQAPSAGPPGPASSAQPGIAPVRRITASCWPADARDGARHGFTPQHRKPLLAALSRLASIIAPRVHGDRVLVLGFEELMYAPQLLGIALSTVLGSAAVVRSSSTTRSPVMVVDRPGYPIRTRLVFPAHDDPTDGPGERYAYNVMPAGVDGARFTDIVLVVDEPADTPALAAPGGLLDSLGGCCEQVHLVVLPSYQGAHGDPPRSTGTALVLAAAAGDAAGQGPQPLRGPAFGSYRAEDVGWLLKDLSQLQLEAPTAVREAAIQAGRAHYAESLPEEYQPDLEYQKLFHAALHASADRIAHAVGVVAEQVLARRGSRLVLVSLARAGTPIGILMRRWLAHAHGLNVPHYAVSIVRGRGIDRVALAWLAEHHDPEQVAFVDGWTGKGAIARELAAAVGAPGRGFHPDLAVLADPGHCVTIFGTREDFLIPSACLNSTVSGLVSRTVLNAEHIGPTDFHGAKYYRDLRDADVSSIFLDAVSTRFEAVSAAVERDWPVLASHERPPSWAGWQVVERIRRTYGIEDANLVKPGVGETTRVLLRRVPWKILAARDAGAELAHVRLLAARRGVEVVEIDDLPYRCVGLIRPGGASTASGAGPAS